MRIYLLVWPIWHNCKYILANTTNQDNKKHNMDDNYRCYIKYIFYLNFSPSKAIYPSFIFRSHMRM
jgi:hypothetical protein